MEYTSLPYNVSTFNVVDANNIYMGATTYNNGTQCYVQKMNDQGQITQQFRVNNCDNSMNLQVRTDPQGNIFISHRNGAEYLVSKYSSSGSFVNSYSMGTTSTILLNSDLEGNIYCRTITDPESLLIFDNGLNAYEATSLGGRLTRETLDIEFSGGGDFYLNTEYLVRKFDPELNLIAILGIVDGENGRPLRRRRRQQRQYLCGR